MLKKSLIVKTRPIANPANVVLWKNYRLTVLDGGLFRLENNAEKIFRDDATLSVWFRDMPAQDFSVKEGKNCLSIATRRAKIILRPKRADCRIELNGKLLKIENRNNLKGTYRTLDCCDGDILYHGYTQDCDRSKIKLSEGVCSKSGVAVFDDADNLTLGADGAVKPTTGLGTDEYIFAYGNDYAEAVRALYAICGRTPLIPKFALGNWWSRYHAYTDREYLSLLNEFKERNIPLTVATVDMDWHYSTTLDEHFKITQSGKNDEQHGGNIGWTGYTWNEDLFPDYRDFLRKIKEMNLKITLNLHPADGVRWFESAYPKMAEALGVDAKTEAKIPFDIASDKFINAYFDVLHKPYEKDGVDFWWIDWQQGSNSKLKGLDPLWSLNHYHYLDNGEQKTNPLILSRYAGIGSFRYPLGFSGDTHITWETLKYLCYFTPTATNVGYTWWSHDIGGHMGGAQDNELFARSVQFGVFSPINRLHSSNAPTFTKEPWKYLNGAGAIASEFMRLRHSMIPFIYSLSYRTHAEGLALIEPLYYYWDLPNAYKYKEEYLFGGLLVAPVTQKTQKDGFARVKAWIPEGVWTDIFTGDCYDVGNGGKEVVLLRSLESIPVLAKAGTILPLSKDGGNAIDNPANLEVLIYKGTGYFELYEDGREFGVENCAFTEFTAVLEDSGDLLEQKLFIKTRGDVGVLPKNRRLRVSFKDIVEGEISLLKNGKKLECEPLYSKSPAIEFELDYNAEYVVTVNFVKRTHLENAVNRAMDVLLSAEGDNRAKAEALNKLKAAKSIEEFIVAVENGKLLPAVKARLKETL